MSDTATIRQLNTWRVFTDRNKVSLAAIENSVAKQREASSKEANSDFPEHVIRCFFDTLAGSYHMDLPLSKDIERLKNVVATIYEVQKDGVLTDEEALAMMNFLLSRFVERRFDRVFKKMLPHGDSKQWFYRSRKVVQ